MNTPEWFEARSTRGPQVAAIFSHERERWFVGLVVEATLITPDEKWWNPEGNGGDNRGDVRLLLIDPKLFTRLQDASEHFELLWVENASPEECLSGPQIVLDRVVCRGSATFGAEMGGTVYGEGTESLQDMMEQMKKDFVGIAMSENWLTLSSHYGKTRVYDLAAEVEKNGFGRHGVIVWRLTPNGDQLFKEEKVFASAAEAREAINSQLVGEALEK